ncbi:hypothetical protein C8J57DRAFT_1508203 [Mycena rebaudengoi]|nr:hypothetical protein C8J57DRAFT_1508203 [Mycena rebaudengoi]
MDEYLQSLPEEAMKELLQVASDGKLTSYFAVAALTFLIYDHLLSFDLEIQFIWMRPKSLACYLYIWNRYLTLAITCVSTCVEIVTMFFIIIDTILESSHYVHAGPLIKGCYSLAVPSIFAFYPVPSLIVTFAMFVMTLYNYRSRRGVSFTSRNLSLADLFLRDGIYWFLAVVGSPPQIIMCVFVRQSLKGLLIIPSIVAYSIVGSRVLLNIMEAMNVDVIHLGAP